MTPVFLLLFCGFSLIALFACCFHTQEKACITPNCAEFDKLTFHTETFFRTAGVY
jgi:hypothetical protein